MCYISQLLWKLYHCARFRAAQKKDLKFGLDLLRHTEAVLRRLRGLHNKKTPKIPAHVADPVRASELQIDDIA
jgi:hypothetical protein